MNILFENNYLRNEALAKEFYRYFYFQRKIAKVTFILLCVGIIITIIKSFLEQQLDYSLLYMPIIVISVVTISYYKSVKNIVKRDNEASSEGISVNIIVSDDCIIRKSSLGDKVSLTFDKFKYAATTKNLILMFSNTNVVTILRKDSFIGGNSEDFMRFLLSKNIKIK